MFYKKRRQLAKRYKKEYSTLLQKKKRDVSLVAGLDKMGCLERGGGGDRPVVADDQVGIAIGIEIREDGRIRNSLHWQPVR